MADDLASMQPGENIGLLTHMSYVGIFMWFFIIDQLVPIPEEVVLLSIGYTAGNSLINPYWAGLAAFCGLTAIDSLFYWLAFSGNKFIKRFKNKISHKLLTRYEKKLKHNTVATVLALSFLPKLRFFSPIMAGMFRVPWKKFLLINGIGTLFCVVTYIIIGLLFHNGLKSLHLKVELIKHMFFALSMIIIGGIIFFSIREKRSSKKRN